MILRVRRERDGQDQRHESMYFRFHRDLNRLCGYTYANQRVSTAAAN